MIDSVPIVVVAYNRPKSLATVLKSLRNANYESHSVPLIISIDKGTNNDDVVKVANDFQWPFGPKEVLEYAENMGLRKHIIKCASLSQKFGNVIILEDDLYVAQNFYTFAIQALEFSKDKDYIGGISLYNHQQNVHKGINFLPIEDGFDNWYFQFASSWGQAWTKLQFQDFLLWYEENREIASGTDIPNYVRSWSSKSWLKYYITYLVEKDKYFLYPKTSFSTNFSDAGTHVSSGSTGYQVPLYQGLPKTFSFSGIEESRSVYDSFFENKKLYRYLDLPKNSICIDLAGYRHTYSKQYVLSPKILNFKIIKSFQRSLRPIESNIMEDMSGDDIFLYDTTCREVNRHKINRMDELMYNFKHVTRSDAIFIAYQKILERIKLFLSKK